MSVKRVVIIGATSGIGLEVAKGYLKAGWQVGIAGRREEELEKLRRTAPGQVCAQVLDVTHEDAPYLLKQLIDELGGMDLFLLSSGIGKQNLSLTPDIELQTAATKRFQNTYIEALDQLAHINRLPIVFTDIRPGFVATPLLKDDKYPLLMNVSAVAAHIINALNKKKRTVIIDRRYQVLVFFWRLIPSCPSRIKKRKTYHRQPLSFYLVIKKDRIRILFHPV